MIAVRIRDEGDVAGLEHGDDRLVPVVAVTRPDASSREDVDLFTVAYLRRRSHLDDEAFRSVLRQVAGGSLARYAGLDDWPLPEPRSVISFADAEALVDGGYADPVELDVDQVERELAAL